MPVNLSIKNVPEALAEKLRARAERNHRSLQGELMAIIEAAAVGEAPLPAVLRGREAVRRGTKTIEEVASELRALFPEPVSDVPRAVDIVRELRDTR